MAAKWPALVTDSSRVGGSNATSGVCVLPAQDQPVINKREPDGWKCNRPAFQDWLQYK